jgi:hypothetical protein
MPSHTASGMNIESSNPAANTSLITEWWTPRLAGPVIAAAVVRLALLVVTLARNGTSALIQLDSATYLEPGRNLLLHGRFVVDGIPDLLRTPGYPLFLAITSLAGLTAAAVVNVILSVFSVFLVWRLGRVVSGEDRIALCAAWIFAFEPMSVVHSVCLASDTLFLTLYLLSMERLAVFLRSRRLPALVAAGLWLAAATFVRPVSYYLPVALAIGLFVVLARKHSIRWKAPALLLIGVMPWLAAWQIRNRIETGYNGFSSISDVNLYFLTAAEVTARVEHRPWLEVRNELGYLGGQDYKQQAYLYQPYLTRNPKQAGWSQGQRLAFMHAEAIRVIRTNYGVYIHYCLLTPLFKTVFNPGAGNYDSLLHLEGFNLTTNIVEDGPVSMAFSLAKAHPWVATEKAAFEVVLLGLYLLAIRGIFHEGIYRSCLWLLLGTSLYFYAVTGVGGGPGADARYRLPIMPAVCILAAAGARRTKLTTVPASAYL